MNFSFLYQNYFNGFRFESPWYLLLLIPLVLLLITAVKRKSPMLSIPWIKPFSTKKSPSGFKKTSIPFIFYSIAFVLVIFAIARPQQGMEELKQRAEGIDIMLALDLSGSMTGIDIPENRTSNQVLRDIRAGKLRKRIAYAKEEIKKFIEMRPNDRIGLVVFAPLPYVACPPTLDHTWLLSHLNSVDAGIIGDATNIAGPVASGVNRLKTGDSKRRVMVLFTDGSNNVNARISPIQAAKLAKTYNVVIYTVGIGSPNAYVLQKTMFGEQFIPLGGQFDKKLLKNIAKETGGKYYSAKDAKGLQEVLSQIDKLEKTSAEQPRFIDYRELASPLVVLALILIITGFVLENTAFIKLP
jgi:Ca-activated chloride channel homolog